MEHQVGGRVHPWAAARLRHLHATGYRECRLVDAHPWTTCVLGSYASMPPGASLQCVQFDSQGELLVSGNEHGLIMVHSARELLDAAATGGLGADEIMRVSPLLALHCGLPKLQSVRWNPADENVVGAASSTSRAVHIYDLQHTQGRPKQVLALPPQSSGGVGSGDLAFFSRGSAASAAGGGYSVLAGGPGGQVFVWDTRGGGGPATTLQSVQGGAVAAVQLAEGDQVVAAGTASGEVKLWDLRGGSGGALRFGGVVQHHPMLACTTLRSALTAVPGLAAQAGGVPPCAVHSMQLDPLNPRRLAFHLGCGWSGVLDLVSRLVTHVHAPPLGLAEDPPDGAPTPALWPGVAAPGLRRRACWSTDGRRFAVPSRARDALALLDFSDSCHAGCYALGDDGGESEDEGEGGARVPPTAAAPLSQAAVCAAALPGTELLVAGGAQNFLSLITST